MQLAGCPVVRDMGEEKDAQHIAQHHGTEHTHIEGHCDLQASSCSIWWERPCYGRGGNRQRWQQAEAAADRDGSRQDVEVEAEHAVPGCHPGGGTASSRGRHATWRAACQHEPEGTDSHLIMGWTPSDEDDNDEVLHCCTWLAAGRHSAFQGPQPFMPGMSVHSVASSVKGTQALLEAGTVPACSGGEHRGGVAHQPVHLPQPGPTKQVSCENTAMLPRAGARCQPCLSSSSSLLIGSNNVACGSHGDNNPAAAYPSQHRSHLAGRLDAAARHVRHSSAQLGNVCADVGSGVGVGRTAGEAGAGEARGLSRAGLGGGGAGGVGAGWCDKGDGGAGKVRGMMGVPDEEDDDGAELTMELRRWRAEPGDDGAELMMERS
ncbi:hypothetical protein HaLaN_10714 [Haematococcus lacustris]|uniref:Uncharacterized protein n=1 Tax=Haematococcus lacustris TaxID=44745 RepID=A0A699YYA0_HAELA|nr:hypothetical protein HaLaN_10714 [Haematococcus lacustris]